MEIENKLRSMGLALPEVAKPVASYCPCGKIGELCVYFGSSSLCERRVASQREGRRRTDG